MALTNFRKESSERSDSANWAKSLLVEKSGYHLDSIEGCNQNASNMVTHLMERARVDYIKGEVSSIDEVVLQIVNLEGARSLQRKINFAYCFGLHLHYVLYCDEDELVYLLVFKGLGHAEVVKTFKSYQLFADWIASVKGWKSTKTFREMNDLPYLDQALRKCGTPWPTNIDCFVSDEDDRPIGVLEFQNAKNTKVTEHCNNDFFLCKLKSTSMDGKIIYHDDIRRWTSQEIIRVQSGLRFFILTWAAKESNVVLKEVEKIALPHFDHIGNTVDWSHLRAYKHDMHSYITSGKTEDNRKKLEAVYKSCDLIYENKRMNSFVNNSPLSLDEKTFPSLYYEHKKMISDGRQHLVDVFVELINPCEK